MKHVFPFCQQWCRIRVVATSSTVFTEIEIRSAAANFACFKSCTERREHAFVASERLLLLESAAIKNKRGSSHKALAYKYTLCSSIGSIGRKNDGSIHSLTPFTQCSQLSAHSFGINCQAIAHLFGYDCRLPLLFLSWQSFENVAHLLPNHLFAHRGAAAGRRRAACLLPCAQRQQLTL